jgi:hypothetical protein
VFLLLKKSALTTGVKRRRAIDRNLCAGNKKATQGLPRFKADIAFVALVLFL